MDKYYTGENVTSCLPPEQAKDRGVSLVLSDWASMSAPLSSNISTTPTWPAVAAKISGVKPGKKKWSSHYILSKKTTLLFIISNYHNRAGSSISSQNTNIPEKKINKSKPYLSCLGAQY